MIETKIVRVAIELETYEALFVPASNWVSTLSLKKKKLKGFAEGIGMI